MTDYSQPGIINAHDYGMVPNNSSYAVAVANGTALLAAINAAQASCATAGGAQYGGIVVIPSNDAVPSGSSNGNGGIYYLAPPGASSVIVPIICYYPLLIMGTGNGTKLVVTQNGDLFSVNNSTGPVNSNIGGVSFKDLRIAYDGGLTVGAAIRVPGAQNVRIFRIVFTDCPVSVALDNSAHAFIRDCTVDNGVNTGTAVSLGTTTPGNAANETHISNCIFLAGAANNSTLGTGISVVNADQVRVVNTRIEAFQQGIVIAPGPTGGSAVHLYFENVTSLSYSPESTGGAALLIQPNGNTSVSQAAFVGCTFGPTTSLASSYTGAGVVVDQSLASGSAGVVDQIRFVSCYSSTWQGSGLQINGAVTNVEILGGTYSCNNNQQAPTHASGIEITTASTGTASGVRIVGAACNNSVFSNGAYLPKTQSYGVLIAQGATNVFVRHCDLTGNVAAAVQASSPAQTVEVTDCAGYNDQATPLGGGVAPPNGQVFYATATYSYCGPMAFYISGGSVQHIKINGNTTGLAAGGFTLSPGEKAELDYTSTPTYYAVGK